MATSPPLHVLVIDDDPDTQANLRDILELDEYQVATVGSAAEALARQDWSIFTAIILDRKLPDSSAEELLPQLRKLAPAAAIMIVTGYTDLQGAIAAIRLGAVDYITKPIDPDLVRSRLARIAEQKRTADEIARLNKDLQHRVNELQTLLDVIPIGIAITQDPGCYFIQVNPALANMLKLPPGANASVSAPASERPPFKVCRQGRELPAADLPMQIAAALGMEVRNEEFDIIHPDGSVVHLVGFASPLFDDQRQPRGAVGAFMDITERKRAQERTLQTERLAAIGQMMTGLAHESGNALARSQACLEMLQWEVQDRPEALELITRIQKAQDHLRQLYEEVRGYAAPLKLEREVWDLGGIWRQAWDNLYVQRDDRDAALQEDVDGVDLRCAVDQFRVEQVFRNILDNALAACKDPVRITIRSRPAMIAGHPAVRVSVQDNGPGLTPEQQQRIFDPFFTTKTKGTGLGMAIARRIMEAHGGQLSIGPAVGGGAEIVLTLPRDPL
jgi:signal transduction histidine kinase/FixJ family two-component response regulator